MQAASVYWIIAYLLVVAIAWRIGAIFLKVVIQRLSLRQHLRCLPGPKAGSLLSGNLAQIFDRADGFEFIESMVDEFGGAVRIKGLLGVDQIYLSDPAALHKVIMNDEGLFQETDGTFHINRVLFGPGITATRGDDHRRHRKILTPAFTPGHLRALVPIFYEIVYKLRDTVEQSVHGGKQEVDILSLLSTTALELIGQAGLGYSFGAFTEEPGEYAASVKQLLPLLFHAGVLLPLLPFVASLGTPAFRRHLATLCPIPAVQQLKRILDIMHNTSIAVLGARAETIAKGEGALLGQIGKGRDIMTILMKANGKSAKDARLSDEEVLAQMNSLIFAAFDTTSGALARLIQQLTARQDVQTALRAEIRQALSTSGKASLEYDEINALPWLDAVCRETLRLYPPVTFLDRTATQDTTLPLSRPIRSVDGSLVTQLPIPEGTNVFVGIAAANRSRETWGADAREWKPERWMRPGGLPDSVAQAKLPGVYSGTMTFWGGHKACLGFKFAQLEMKIVLLVLLDAFEFLPCPERPVKWQLAMTLAPYVQGQEHMGPALPVTIRIPQSD